MTGPAANMSVWVGAKVVCFKISGRANFTASVDFRAAIYGLRGQGHTRFVLDLTDCLLMDSTFLGVLSGIGIKFSSPQGTVPAATIELLNPNARIADLLENLGIAHLFTLAHGPAMNTDSLACFEQSPVNPDHKTITQTCLEAHRLLMDINPANVPKFMDVAQFLAEDLKKMEAADKARKKEG